MTDQDKHDDPRSQQIAARKKRMRELSPPLPRVRVTPRDDDMRRVLRHPTGVKFPSGGGSAEWPLDQFTRRRLKDGSVAHEQPQGEQPPDEARTRRTRSPQPEPSTTPTT